MRKIIVAFASVEDGAIEKKAAFRIWPPPIPRFVVYIYRRTNWKAVWQIITSLFWLCLVAAF